MNKKNQRTIWIDFDNSPHVLFFNPIIKELEKRDIKVSITARDFAQVKQLVELFDIKAEIIGKHFGKNFLFKLLGIIVRSLQLMPFAIKNRPNLALSHGSRAQFLAAKILGIKTGIALDYEYIQMFPFLKADVVFAPKMIKKEKITLKYKKIFQFDGIKEDVYVPYHRSSDRGLEFLESQKQKIIILIRPPAELAHYYSEKSKNNFETLLKYLSSRNNLLVVFTPRTKEQGVNIRANWSSEFESGKFCVPEKVVNGLDLINSADLVISGGGTMIREAAAMGIPAYSTFGSQIGAVDKYLEENGRLILLQSEDDIENKLKLIKRENRANKANVNNDVLPALINKICKIIEN